MLKHDLYDGYRSGCQVRNLGDTMSVYHQYYELLEMPKDDGGSLVVAEKEANARYQVSRPHAPWDSRVADWLAG